MTGYYRTHATLSDQATPFSGIPLEGWLVEAPPLLLLAKIRISASSASPRATPVWRFVSTPTPARPSWLATTKWTSSNQPDRQPEPDLQLHAASAPGMGPCEV